MLEPAGQSGPRTPPVNPQLALRVAILGGIAFALFAIVFLRLWFMQVLTGDRYRQDALDNRSCIDPPIWLRPPARGVQGPRQIVRVVSPGINRPGCRVIGLTRQSDFHQVNPSRLAGLDAPMP